MPALICGGLQEPQNRPLNHCPATPKANLDTIICLREGKNETNPKPAWLLHCVLLFPSNTVVSDQTRSSRLRKLRCFFPLYSLILHHVHYNPVEGIDVLPDEILEHDECFHQKILKRRENIWERLLFWIRKVQVIVSVINDSTQKVSYCSTS